MWQFSGNGIGRRAPEGEKTASLWCPTGLGLQRRGSKVKKAVPVRMPDWPEEELPSTKQVEVYLLFWEHQQKPLAPDPGIGFLQKSFWLDPEELDISAHQAECYRANRLDRGLFIRRLIATYHKRTTSRPSSHAAPAVRQPKKTPTFPGLVAASSAILRPVSPSNGVRGADLTPSEVNEISRAHGLAMCWQPGNVYRVGRAVNGKSCLVQIDLLGRELARYGSW